jgi:hypothetical protein
LLHFFALLHDTFHRQPIGDSRILGVVSDNNVTSPSRSGSLSHLTPQRVFQAIPDAEPRYLRQALKLYARFCSLDLVFDNRRLLAEGVEAPPRFTDYMRVRVESSTCTIFEQMRVDLEPALAVA